MRIIGDIFGIITLIIIVAIVAVVLSPNSQTATVIQSTAAGLAQLLQTVVSPVTQGK